MEYTVVTFYLAIYDAYVCTYVAIVWCNIILMENLGKITFICENIPYQSFALCACVYAYVCTWRLIHQRFLLFFYCRPKINVPNYALCKYVCSYLERQS